MEVTEVAVDESKKISEGQAIFFANKGAIVLVLTVLVLLVYAVAGYADPKLISNSDNYLFRSLYDQLQSLRTDYTNIQSSKGFDVTAIDAVQTATPTFSRSHYIETSPDTRVSDLQALGQQDIQWTVTSHQCSTSNYASLVILDFGEPHTSQGVYGTSSVHTNLFWSDTDIADAARQFILAWNANPSACRLKLAIGLSNHKQITVWGAYDAETTWDGADRTRQFVNGFNGNDTSRVPLLDFGDMRQGAPLTDPDTGQAEQTWTNEDRYYVAWKAPYDISLPEIYDPSTLQDWVSLQQSHHDMNFIGIMTEACSQAGTLSSTDPRLDCGSIYNGYGFIPGTAMSQLKQNMLQHSPLHYITSMPVPN